MARNDLLRQLIASPHALPPPQPRNLIVSPQGQLPPQARFGPMSPGQVTNSPFTGAVPRGGPLNLIHPTGPADFQAPTYSPLTPVGPTRSILTALAPIVGASLVGGAGATAPPAATFRAPPPPPGAGIPGAQQVPSINYANPVRQQAPTGEVFEGRIPQLGGGSSLGALIASLAQQGRKVSPGGSAYTKAF